MENTRQQIIENILENKLIVIVRGLEKEKMLPLAEAMYAGGIRLMEITYAADGSVPEETTAESIRLIRENFAMSVGAGTVLTKRQVELTKAAGGGFIISPNVCESVIRRTRELDMVSIPGAMTPTEIQQAHLLGADFVKLFPAAQLGTDYIKAIRAPLSHIRMLAVGGIDYPDLQSYMKAGICGFGMGSNIVDKQAIARGDYAYITELARRFTDATKIRRDENADHR